jgi:hypothetical protein
MSSTCMSSIFVMVVILMSIEGKMSMDGTRAKEVDKLQRNRDTFFTLVRSLKGTARRSLMRLL